MIEGHLPWAAVRRTPPWSPDTGGGGGVSWWNDETDEASESAKTVWWCWDGLCMQNSSMNQLKAGTQSYSKRQQQDDILAITEGVLLCIWIVCPAGESSWNWWSQIMTSCYEWAWVTFPLLHLRAQWVHVWYITMTSDITEPCLSCPSTPWELLAYVLRLVLRPVSYIIHLSVIYQTPYPVYYQHVERVEFW